MNKALSRYCEVLEGRSRPRFRLLDMHGRIDEAFRLLEKCELCERRCLVDRTNEEVGVCKVGNRMLISSCCDHYGEEHFFVPSFTIFFKSCTFFCQFCQNWEISQAEDISGSHAVGETELARLIDLHGYCKNVNFVGGEPTPHLPFILKTLTYVRSDIPVVWNSNFYMSEKAMSLLKGAVDVYLSDFKYGNDGCAMRLSRVDDYSEIVRRNHLLAFEDSEVVIRHLILPNHVECCTKPVLEFIADNFADRVVVNLMDQYRPCYKAEQYSDINRRIRADEFQQAVVYARDLGVNFIT